jgi:hypothetical protein
MNYDFGVPIWTFPKECFKIVHKFLNAHYITYFDDKKFPISFMEPNPSLVYIIHCEKRIYLKILGDFKHFEDLKNIEGASYIKDEFTYPRKSMKKIVSMLKLKGVYYRKFLYVPEKTPEIDYPLGEIIPTASFFFNDDFIEVKMNQEFSGFHRASCFDQSFMDILLCDNFRECGSIHIRDFGISNQCLKFPL